MSRFTLHSDFSPDGDQPEAISQLVAGLKRGSKHQTLLGVTGSGKTFTMANVIAQSDLPVLVISHNKTLAAQLYDEFKAFFPENAVEYFVSFYDYYQPEAYIPSSDTYIEKTADINDEIDRLRLKATASLMARKDVIIVASVSCIYNIGSPDSYAQSSVIFKVGDALNRDEIFRRLFKMHYSRNDHAFERGVFRVRGDIIDVFPGYEDHGIRIETFGDSIERISRIHPVTGQATDFPDAVTIFPAKHFVTTGMTMKEACDQIESEMNEQVAIFERQGKLLEAQRLKQRTKYDIEMLLEVGYVNGIENYSRILDKREPGSRPHSLIEFFGGNFLTIIDESHATIPQVGGMYNGDRARKETLVEHGFRIPSALDNRPLRFNEFEELLDKVIYLSATPADYELEKSGGIIVEQIIRPTGLVDPPLHIKPALNQVDDLVEELRVAVAKGHRALVTTLTKKMAEDLSTYLDSLDFKVRYLHSEIDTLERPEILRALREGEFDVLVGINLLREGLDLPEVALVAILDADKEGFLRSTRSLIQIAGRAARHVEGRIVLYADTITKSIAKTIDECERRRKKQLEYNEKHGIVPQSTKRKFGQRMSSYKDTDPELLNAAEELSSYGNGKSAKKHKPMNESERNRAIAKLEKEMKAAASALDFERAAELRDEIASLKGLK